MFENSIIKAKVSLENRFIGLFNIEIMFIHAFEIITV